MKVAILSDIHGNIDALNAVLEEVRRLNILKLLVLGDNVGYFYYPHEVINALSKFEYEYINGNHEQLLMDVLDNKLEIGTLTKKYGQGHKMAIEKLTTEQLEDIRRSSFQKAIYLDGMRILMCHGSPWNMDTYVYPDAVPEVTAKFNLPEYDLVFFGHTHYPCLFKAGHTLVVNPGSVGQSRLQGGITNWCVLNTENKVVQPMSTGYDVRPLLNTVKQYDPTIPYMQDVLKRNNKYLL